MEIVKMRTNYVKFCGIFITAVIAIGSSDNPLTEENNFEYPCSNKNLSIDFSGSEIRVLGENFISSPVITCLKLEGNQIEIVRKGAFDGLPELRYLNMAGNKINDLISFGSHENLETLILANQSYRYRNELTFTGIYPYLRYLDLSNNMITSINWIIGKNFDYRDLSQQIPRLANLNLANNRISRLFTEDFSSSSLSLILINLNNNEMELANLRYLKNIAIVMADNNRFQYLHKNHCNGFSFCISDMAKLQILSLSNNELIDIGRDFFKLTPKLLFLNLSSNQLDNKVDELFDNLISLQTLDLDNNRLTNIPTFKKQSILYIFSASRNKIKSIGSEDLINMKNLRKLSMNNNDLSNIDKNAFRSLNLLEELYLANNVLTNLPAEWATNLKSLRYLDVTSNKFKYLESLSLSKTLPLIKLDLVDNEISSITTKTFLDIPENVTIYLVHDKREIELKISDEEMISYDYEYN